MSTLLQQSSQSPSLPSMCTLKVDIDYLEEPGNIEHLEESGNTTKKSLEGVADSFFIGTLTDAAGTQKYISKPGCTLNLSWEDVCSGHWDGGDGSTVGGSSQWSDAKSSLGGGGSRVGGSCSDPDAKSSLGGGGSRVGGSCSDPEGTCSHSQENLETLNTTAIRPQLLRFTAPENSKMGESVCISGPHGPLIVPLPEDAQPGERCAVRLAPPVSCIVTVPSDAGPGQKIHICGPDGAMVQVTVPLSKHAGEAFEVFPAVLMVHVPEGASTGDMVAFDALDGEQRLCATVPEVFTLVLGTYFPVFLKK